MGSGTAFGVSRREQLGQLAMAVNYALQGHAQCITGVAILVQVARACLIIVWSTRLRRG